MKLVFLGKQGSGKGTQAEIISRELGLCHISTGDLLRNTKGKIGKQIHSLIDKGEMVSDELIFEILKKRIKKPDCKNGFILEGFPRNLKQAIMLENQIDIDLIIEIYLPDNLVINRLIHRLNCSKCGAVFNSVTNPPKKSGICDFCGGKLIKRQDDNKQAIKKRLELYHKNFWPIIDFLRDKIIRIDGSKKIPEVTREILNALETF